MGLKKATVKAFEIDPTPGNLSGLKTVIGVLLIAAAHSLDAVNDVALMLPGWESAEVAREGLATVVLYAERALELLGSGFIGFGLLDKVRKFFGGFFGR
jgi:hypothetical protein